LSEYKNAILNAGKLFVDNETKRRETIAFLGSKFLQDGMVN
jgi:hypothetical protein